MLVMGDEEVKHQTVTVRDYKTKEQVLKSKAEFVEGVLEEIEARVL